MKKYLILSFLLSTNLLYGFSTTEQKIYDALKIARKAKKANKKERKELANNAALLVEQNFINTGVPGENIGGEEVVSLTSHSGDIISQFLNDGLFFRGKELLSDKPRKKQLNQQEKILADRFLDSALGFKLALASYQSADSTDCDHQSFAKNFDPTDIDPSSMLTLKNLPMDPRLMRRLSFSTPEDGLAEYYFHNGNGDVVKISFIDRKPKIQIFTMITYEGLDDFTHLTDEAKKRNLVKVGLGAQREIASKQLGKTNIALLTGGNISADLGNQEENASGAQAQASLLAEKGNRSILFTGGIKAVCKKNSDCDDLTDYRHIQLGSVEFENPTFWLKGQVSTDKDVLEAEIKRGYLKGTKAGVDTSGKIDLSGAYRTIVLEQEVKYSFDAKRKKSGETSLDVNVEDSNNNKYSFSRNTKMTKLSLQNNIFKSRTASCTGIYELFNRHEERVRQPASNSPHSEDQSFWDPRFGSDAFDSKGAGVAVTVHCKS